MIKIFYYHNSILSYYHIILAQYNIYWHFFNHGFCFSMAPYQWFWIIEDCSRHRISARIFSMFKKTPHFHNFFVFLGPGSLGPGPMVPPGAHGAPHFSDFLTFCKMTRDLSKSVPMVFRTPEMVLIKLFHFIFNSKCHFLKVRFFI